MEEAKTPGKDSTKMNIQAIILAAGMGKRMQPLTEGLPKALLKYEGNTLLGRIVEQIANQGIEKISVVVGYEKQKVKKELKRYSDLGISIIENDRFEEDKNIFSLTLALQHRLMPFILIEADTIFPDGCFDTIVNPADNRSMWYTIGPFLPGMYGGILKADEWHKVVDLQIVPEYLEKYRNYRKLVGLLKVGPEQLDRYYSLLIDACEENTNQYYHAPWIQHIEEFTSYVTDLSTFKIMSVNTVEEYYSAFGICLIEIEKLRPIEGHGKKRVEWLKNKILEEGWTKPIVVEKDNYLVMDGMHRLEAAKELNLTYVPCQLFAYGDVEVWSLRRNHVVTREIVTHRALSGDIYPYKTAKHRFPLEIQACVLPLDLLK